MSFKGLLNELVNEVPGAQGEIIADWEGEAVDQSGRMDDYELKVIGAHKRIIQHNLGDVEERLGDGEVVGLIEQLKDVVLCPNLAGPWRS